MPLRGSKVARGGREGELIKTTYISKPVPIPDSFLSTSAENVGQVTYNKINFSQTQLPEYEGLYAAILDNVLSPAECTELIKLAQLSAGAGEPGVEEDGWQPAMVNGGPGGEFLATGYRNSDRIIWDERTIVQRLLVRCFLAEQLQADLSTIEGKAFIIGSNAVMLGHRWKITRLNERMRFLRYGPGQFFKGRPPVLTYLARSTNPSGPFNLITDFHIPSNSKTFANILTEHCDGTYQTPDGRERTFYTLHLYLNDSVNANPSATKDSTAGEGGEEAPFPELLIKGGATTFWGNSMQRRLDVNPKAGRVLIFQHRGLLHSGDEVHEGVKYTMRTDLLYEFDKQSGKLGD